MFAATLCRGHTRQKVLSPGIAGSWFFGTLVSAPANCRTTAAVPEEERDGGGLGLATVCVEYFLVGRHSALLCVWCGAVYGQAVMVRPTGVPVLKVLLACSRWVRQGQSCVARDGLQCEVQAKPHQAASRTSSSTCGHPLCQQGYCLLHTVKARVWVLGTPRTQATFGRKTVVVFCVLRSK